MVENHFKTINYLKKNPTQKKFRSSIIPLFVINRLMHKINRSNLTSSETVVEEPIQKLNFSGAAMIVTKVLSHKQKVLSRLERIRIKESEKFQEKISEYENESMNLAPKLEGRIICIRDQQVRFLLLN